MSQPLRPRIEPLQPHHDRKGFSSGADELDRYLRQQAGQDARRHVAAPFVLLDPTNGQVAGYYTLSAFAVAPTELPPDLAKKLPRYPLVPTHLLGRLAVATAFQGRGYGEFLLIDALHRTLKHVGEVATIGVVVEARDDRALAFYEHFGFLAFPNHPQRLLMPIETIARLFPPPVSGSVSTR